MNVVCLPLFMSILSPHFQMIMLIFIVVAFMVALLMYISTNLPATLVLPSHTSHVPSRAETHPNHCVVDQKGREKGYLLTLLLCAMLASLISTPGSAAAEKAHAIAETGKWAVTACDTYERKRMTLIRPRDSTQVARDGCDCFCDFCAAGCFLFNQRFFCFWVSSFMQVTRPCPSCKSHDWQQHSIRFLRHMRILPAWHTPHDTISRVYPRVPFDRHFGSSFSNPLRRTPSRHADQLPSDHAGRLVWNVTFIFLCAASTPHRNILCMSGSNTPSPPKLPVALLSPQDGSNSAPTDEISLATAVMK